jgi:hypothetical protein
LLDPNNPEDLHSLNKTRDIVQEILNFGVNNNEMLKIIELLSLELESTDIMKKISEALKPNIEENTKKELIIER